MLTTLLNGRTSRATSPRRVLRAFFDCVLKEEKGESALKIPRSALWGLRGTMLVSQHFYSAYYCY